jgi:hypothetical protein
MANETVIVGCKLPNGLILEVEDKRVCLRGSRIVSQPNQRKGYVAPEVIYADSINLVNKEFWEAWTAKVGKNYKPLRSGAIYASSNKIEATAKAKESADEKTGFEGVDPNKKPTEVFSKDMSR